MKKVLLLVGLIFLAGCTPTTAVPTTAPAITATPPAAPTEEPTPEATAANPVETFSDPFAYCAAVGTVDAPDAHYNGPAMPESVAQGLQVALQTDMPLEVLNNGASWRCMDGQVYACFVGANLPCTEKANTDETPAQPLIDFCQQADNTNAEVIPAAVTGHNTVYSWRCSDGKPAIVQQVFQVDAQGFIADIWYPISAPPAGGVITPTTSSALTTTGAVTANVPVTGGKAVSGTQETIGKANPASANCLAKGGTMTIEQRGDGGEFGVCTFEDNRQCEEWALLNGACPVGGRKVTGYLTAAARYCAITGGQYADNGTTSADNEQGICTFSNGSTCPAADYFNGKCTP